MSELTYALAQTLLSATLAYGRAHKLSPLAVAVIDARGALRASGAEDGTSLLRWKVALAKASGTIDLGVGSRRIGAMAVERPHFVSSLHDMATHGLVPVAGGVLIRDADKRIIGAIGVSGDSSDNDEAAASSAIAAAGLIADGG